MQRLFAIFLIIFFATGCSLFYEEKEDHGKALAQVNGNYLYLSDVVGITNGGLSPDDSVRRLKKYVDNWIRRQLVLGKAEASLPESKKDLKRQLEEYRNSLLIYEYEKVLIDQSLDTNVAEAEIEDFYNKNQDNFELKSNIVKFNYIRLKPDAPKIELARKWLDSEKDEDKFTLEDYCAQYSTMHNLNDSSWYEINELIQLMPGIKINAEQLMQKGLVLNRKANDAVYLIKIKDFMLKDGVSPLSTVRNDIVQIILHKRRQKFLEEIYSNLYQDAYKKNDFEIYM